MDVNPLLGTTGIYMALMLFFFDALPMSPLEGKRVYNWNKGVWALAFIMGLGLLYGWLLGFIGAELLNLSGLFCIIALVMTLAYQGTLAPE